MGIALSLGMAAVALLASPTAASALDFGDAPDGKRARYAEKPRVIGKFPALAASGGPRHSSSGPSLGGWTSEKDSRQVDADRDDGAQLNPRSCALSTMTVTVDASKADPSAPLFVNAWFDWNQDGDWGDGGSSRCGPEWGVQNVVVDPASLGDDRVAVVTLRFRAGRVPRQVWWRVQLQSGAPVPHLAGGGEAEPTSGGETEDWFYDRFPREEERIALNCYHPNNVMLHGRELAIPVQLGGFGEAKVIPGEGRARLAGNIDGLVLERELLSGPTGSIDSKPIWQFRVNSTRKHKRASPLQYADVKIEADVTINGRPRTFKARCKLVVSHTERVVPPGPMATVLTPAVGIEVDPDRPDPVAARCAARFRQFPSNMPLRNEVLARCDGIDYKTVSVWAGANAQRITQHQSPPNTSCELVDFASALHCSEPPPNKGSVLSIYYDTNEAFARTRVHILAGGRGRTGNTIVLLQDWFITRSGFVCRQSVPRAAACAVAEASGAA